MATNTFPTTGPAGVNTGLTPAAPFHVLSGNASNEIARFQRDTNSGNVRGFVSLYGTNPQYSWELSIQDANGSGTTNGLSFNEAPSGPSVSRVYFATGGRVGIGTTTPIGQFAVTSGNNTFVQLLGPSAAATGAHSLNIGYGAVYNTSFSIGEAAYLQAELQGSYETPLLLNPIGGQVAIGLLAGGGGNDIDNLGRPSGRFIVTQLLTGSGSVQTASFALNTTSFLSVVNGGPPDSGAGKFSASASGTSNANLRGMESHVLRYATATVANTWGIEVGVHTQVAGDGVTQNVGVYIASNQSKWFSPTGSAVQADSAILVDYGDSGGWNSAFYYRGKPGNMLYRVDGAGSVYTSGNVSASGNMYAQNFFPTSSRELKFEIGQFPVSEATEMLIGLRPVKFRFKSDPPNQHVGFIAEDVPAYMSPNGKSLDLTAMIATLTNVVQQHEQAIRLHDEQIHGLLHRDSK